MTSFLNEVPRGVLWGVRGIVFGSLAMAGYHIYPIWCDSTLDHAVLLAADDNRNYAREGVRRLRRQASQSDQRRRELLKRGAVTTLARAAEHPDESVRDAALHALSVFAVGVTRDHPHTQAVRQLLRFRSVADALVASDCQKGCHALWNTIVSRERSQSRQQRIEQLRLLNSDSSNQHLLHHHSSSS